MSDAWEKAKEMFTAMTHGVLGDKNKGWQPDFPCCYFMCPSHTNNQGAHEERCRPSKNKFIQKLSPSVYQFQCKYCGCLMNASVEISSEGRECWRVNPALMGGRPTDSLWGGARCR